MASMKGKVNVNGLKKFQQGLNKMNEAQRLQWNEAAIKELAARLLAKVIKRTPVGQYDKPVDFIAHLPETVVSFTTKGGKTVSFTAKAREKHVHFQPNTGKKGGTLRRNWTVGEVVKTGNQYTIEVINPTEYAPYVEFGHRTADHSGWVEGKFMLTISEQELQKDAPKILMNKLKNFMGGVFA
jgi:hypothetical protein